MNRFFYNHNLNPQNIKKLIYQYDLISIKIDLCKLDFLFGVTNYHTMFIYIILSLNVIPFVRQM